jgi:hypothetical protein
MIFMSSSFAAAGNYSGAKVTGIWMGNYSASSSKGDFTIYLNKSDGNSLGYFWVRSTANSDWWKSLLALAMFAYQNNLPVNVIWDANNNITEFFPLNN